MEKVTKKDLLEVFFSNIKQTSLKDSDILVALDLLLKLLTNIINNPQEQKYRSIKRSNPTLKAKLFNVPIIDQVLQTLGFIIIDDSYVFSSSSPIDLINAIPVIRGVIEDINIQNLPAEEKAKKLELQKRQRELEYKFKKEKEEAEKLKLLSQLDRKEKSQEEKARDSIPNTLNFGANTKGFKDIGIDLNKKRRG